VDEKPAPKPLPHVVKAVVPLPPRKSLGNLAIILALVALLALGITWGMGWLATEAPPVSELYQRSLDGSREVKRAAATEWARQLHSAAERQQVEVLAELRPPREQAFRLGEVLLRQSEEDAREPDPVYLSSLATVVGFAVDAEPAQLQLLEALRLLGLERMPELQVYVVIALARLGVLPPDRLALIIERIDSSEPALRKAAAFALGAVGGRPLAVEAQDALIRLLEDAEQDVRWNAAIALAHQGNRAGFKVLQELLERAEKSDREGGEVLSLNALEVYREALRASMKLADPELVRIVERVAHDHPNLKLRQAAKEQLAN
jgi:HEAT repeat protein